MQKVIFYIAHSIAEQVQLINQNKHVWMDHGVLCTYHLQESKTISTKRRICQTEERTQNNTTRNDEI